MTTGSHSNHHPLPPRDDREALSALFDGELPGDAARFALKRLDHDAGWRETCGRWQLIGDALRGEATSAAPADFASGVMRILAAEGQAAALAASPASSQVMEAAAASSRRRWIGGAALAASVAMAAMLVVRPFSQPSSPVLAGQVATGVTSPPSNQAPRLSAVEAGMPAPAVAVSPDSTSPVAVADVPQPTASRRALRPTRAVSRPTSSSMSTEQSPASVSTTAVATATPEPVRPFHPPAEDIVTRPWPRAVLPDSGAAGALTVGFGTSTATSPSLYPFEPRLPSEAPSPRPVTEPQR